MKPNMYLTSICFRTPLAPNKFAFLKPCDYEQTFLEFYRRHY